MPDQVLSIGSYVVRLPEIWGGHAEVLEAPPLRFVTFGHSGVSGQILVGEDGGTAEGIDLYLSEQVERFPGKALRDTIDVFGCKFQRAVIESTTIDEEITGSVRVHAIVGYGDLVGFRMLAADPIDPSFEKLCFSAALTVFGMLMERGEALFAEE